MSQKNVNFLCHFWWPVVIKRSNWSIIRKLSKENRSDPSCSVRFHRSTFSELPDFSVCEDSAAVGRCVLLLCVYSTRCCWCSSWLSKLLPPCWSLSTDDGYTFVIVSLSKLTRHISLITTNSYNDITNTLLITVIKYSKLYWSSDEKMRLCCWNNRRWSAHHLEQPTWCTPRFLSDILNIHKTVKILFICLFGCRGACDFWPAPEKTNVPVGLAN